MKWDWKKLNFKDKNTWLILGIVGVLLLVIAIPVDRSGRKDPEGIARPHMGHQFIQRQTPVFDGFPGQGKKALQLLV